MARYYPITADRGLVFRDYFVFVGENLTGATFKMQVRSVPDTGGTPLVDLVTVTDASEGLILLYAGTDTVASHIAAGRIDAQTYEQRNPATGNLYQPTDNVLLSQVRAIISEPTMTAPPTGRIALSEEVGDPSICAYDLLVKRSGSFSIKEFYGEFVVKGTVTVE